MLKDEFCTTQGSACIIFMGADFWAARIYEWWVMGNAKTGCGASNLRNSASNKRGAAHRIFLFFIQSRSPLRSFMKNKSTAR